MMTAEYVALSVDAANELYRRIKSGTREEALEYFTKAAERISISSAQPQVSQSSTQTSVFGAALTGGIIGGMVSGG